MGRQAFGTHGFSGNVFANPTASSSTPYPQESNLWISNVSEHTSPHVTSERQTPDTTLDPRCQSGPSARNSFDPSLWGKILKEFQGRPPTTADFGSSLWQILHSNNIHLLEDKIQDCGVYLLTISDGMLCCGSKKWRWLNQWMIFFLKKKSRSFRGIQTPDFEVLDAKIASALNRLIHNNRFKKKVSGETESA